MKALRKFPKDIKIFLFIIAVRGLLKGVPLEIFRNNMKDLQNYEKHKKFKDIHKKLAGKNYITPEELEFLIEYERKRQWEKM